MSGKEEEMVTSSYTVAELWQRHSLLFMENIFSYFSVQDLNKMSRYSLLGNSISLGLTILL